jgi:hypothetical protein
MIAVVDEYRDDTRNCTDAIVRRYVCIDWFDAARIKSIRPIILYHILYHHDRSPSFVDYTSFHVRSEMAGEERSNIQRSPTLRNPTNLLDRL